MQGQELHRKLGVLEEEVRAARQSQEETRRQQQSLLRDHESLAQLQRRQEAELEGLLARHRDLKANMRALELAHRELQGRCVPPKHPLSLRGNTTTWSPTAVPFPGTCVSTWCNTLPCGFAWGYV